MALICLRHAAKCLPFAAVSPSVSQRHRPLSIWCLIGPHLRHDQQCRKRQICGHRHVRDHTRCDIRLGHEAARTSRMHTDAAPVRSHTAPWPTQSRDHPGSQCHKTRLHGRDMHLSRRMADLHARPRIGERRCSCQELRAVYLCVTSTAHSLLTAWSYSRRTLHALIRRRKSKI